jgi:hypothetical protein
MIFTIGCIMMMIGFVIGHSFGDQRLSVWNKYDHIGVWMFVFGVLGALSSIFTITWKYMP